VIAMKRLLVIAVLAAVCLICGLIWVSFHRRYAFVAPTHTYASLEQAIWEGAVRDGWLPDGLPRSAHNIREKHNYEQNTVIASFSFDPSDNMLPMLSEAEELPGSILEAVRPPVLGARAAWFPDAITDGKFGMLTRTGFRFYRLEQRSKVGQAEVTDIWHFAVNREAGTCYLWFFQRTPALR
jgi:hypothetical protein